MRLAAAISFSVALAAGAATSQQSSIAGSDGGQNALGKLPCSTAGLAMAQCPFEVFGKSGGNATVRVLLPTGDVRVIYFENGKPAGTDSTSKMSFEQAGAATVVFIDPAESYEIPNAVLASD